MSYFAMSAPFCAVFVILAEELVAPGIERRDFDHRGLPGGNHLLGVEVIALEFLGCGVRIGDLERQVLAGRNLELRGVEAMVLDGDREFFGQGRGCESHHGRQREGKQQAH
jgi:hypothetical protein